MLHTLRSIQYVQLENQNQERSVAKKMCGSSGFAPRCYAVYLQRGSFSIIDYFEFSFSILECC